MHTEDVHTLPYFFQCRYFRNHLKSFKQNGQFNFSNPSQRKCEAVGHVHDHDNQSVLVGCEEKDHDTVTHDDSDESKTQIQDDENSEENGEDNEI